MRKLVFWILILCSGCSIIKEKHRLEIDSINVVTSTNQWQLKTQLRDSGYQLVQHEGLQALRIEANAPFIWQLDSGLKGGAGIYHLYFRHQGNSLKKEVKTRDQKLTGKQIYHQKEISKQMITDKKQSAISFKAVLLLGLGVLLISGIFFIRWSYMRRI